MTAIRLIASWVIVALAVPFCVLGALGMAACMAAEDIRGRRQ